MQLLTPDSLHYPITVTKVLHQSGDNVSEGDILFSYEYKSKVVEYDEETREDVERTRSHYSDFQCEFEGNISLLRVQKGHVIKSRTVVAEVEESCKHETQFGGICADCGKDMTFVQYNSSARNTDRATVNMAHQNTNLRVSLAQASKADEEAKRRLLRTRKLSLVVDLDQTIIHATVDPTVAEWQKDPENPNYAAVKDVQAFQLMDDAPGARGMWYYIKLRPGLESFLRRISKEYELHIYTMGTRAYAENIAKIIDPKHEIFADRILSRDESGSMTAKNLKRLFPVDTKMVVIIDDRGDVWHWSPNLVKVVPYDFFVGIGDINSSFLPKRPELEASSSPKLSSVANSESDESKKEPAAASAQSEGSTPEKAERATATTAPANGTASAVERLVSMAGNQDEGSIRVKADQQDEAIAQQLADRPLLQKQKILDAKEEEAKAAPAVDAAVDMLSEENNDDSSPFESTNTSKYRHNLLQDDDNELQYLERSLNSIHRTYFDEYDKESAGSKGGRVADIRHGGHAKKRSVDDLDNIPDVAQIMASSKSQVLAGVHIVFSGVIPIGSMLDRHDTVIWARSFGATVSEHVSKRTTHVIASPERRTAKVRQAAKRGKRVHIVSQGWLFACFTQWAKVDETPYRIHSDAQQQQQQEQSGTNGSSSQALPDSFEGRDQLNLSDSEDEAAVTEDDSDANVAATAGVNTPKGNSVGGAGAAVLEVDTDTEELQKYAPTTKRDDVSPVGNESPDYWDDINDELNEFLGEDDSEDDDNDDGGSSADESASGALRRAPGNGNEGRKRKRGVDDNEDSDASGNTDTESADESAAEGGSRLQQKKRKALSRTSSLVKVTTVSNAAAATAAPVDGSGAVERSGDDGNEEMDDEEEEAELDLEAALAAEMERTSTGVDDAGEGG